MTYFVVKHSHMLLAVLSIFLLVFRSILMFRASPLLQAKLIKVVPHVIDTFLLLTAISLMVLINQYPIQSPWLTEKLVAVVLYIVSGVFALKVCKTNASRAVALALAGSWVMLILHLATSKQAILLG